MKSTTLVKTLFVGKKPALNVTASGGEIAFDLVGISRMVNKSSFERIASSSSLSNSYFQIGQSVSSV